MVSLTDTTGDLLGSELSFEFGVLVLLGLGLVKGGGCEYIQVGG